jgi:hypothetical protein
MTEKPKLRSLSEKLLLELNMTGKLREGRLT